MNLLIIALVRLPAASFSPLTVDVGFPQIATLYWKSMRSVRALLALMLVLALALGTGQPMASAAEMPASTQASDMVMNATASDLSMSGMCDKCIKKDPATHACFAVCIGVQAVLPAMSFLRVSATAPLDPVVDRLFSGSAGPPDPPPPKATLLA